MTTSKGVRMKWLGWLRTSTHSQNAPLSVKAENAKVIATIWDKKKTRPCSFATQNRPSKQTRNDTLTFILWARKEKGFLWKKTLAFFSRCIVFCCLLFVCCVQMELWSLGTCCLFACLSIFKIFLHLHLFSNGGSHWKTKYFSALWVRYIWDSHIPSFRGKKLTFRRQSLFRNNIQGLKLVSFYSWAMFSSGPRVESTHTVSGACHMISGSSVSQIWSKAPYCINDSIYLHNGDVTL